MYAYKRRINLICTSKSKIKVFIEMPEVRKLKGKEAAGSYLFMYLVVKLLRQEFLSRWAMFLINFSSRTSAVLQMKKQVFFKETCLIQFL